MRQATATFSRRRLQNAPVENAPYKPGDVLADRYEIKDVVGAGPVGFVFRAADRQVDVEVALKVVNPRLVQTPDERRQFARTIRLGRKLGHQNLLRVYEEGEDHDRPFFTMQFLEGLTLRKIIDLRVQKNEYFSLREIEPILGQIASALDGAHKVGAHSNLKPENVIVLPDLLKVGDFGLALAIPHLPFVQAAKQRKADRYLAPEYVQGHEVDQRADIYSLGVILGEMLSGLTPDGAIPELARRNPEVPPQLEGLYRKTLNSNPLARPKTATELFEEFAEITRRVSPPPLRKASDGPAPAVSRPRPAIPPPGLAASNSITSTVELRRRTPEKPPPPVPDIEEESIEVPVNGASQSALVPDATQPISSGSIPIPPPPPDDAHETQVMPAIPDVGTPPELQGEPTESRPIPGTSTSRSAGVWFFVLFTLLGLSLGAAGGYWLLKRSRQSMQPLPPAPSAATTPPVKPPVAAASTGPTGATAATDSGDGASRTNVQLDPGTSAADPNAEARQRAEEAKRADDERRRQKEAAMLAAQQSEQRRLEEEKRLAEEAKRAEAEREEQARREAEAARAAEETRRAEEIAAKLAEEKRRAEETAAKLAEEKRRAEERKETVVAAATVPKSQCPEGMRFIPAGSFKMGTARNDPMMGFDEKILTSVSVAAFCIDTYEYPNQRGAMPKVGVSWTEAKRSCEAKGKRLCTEEEWEKACKGPGNARYPYGNTYDPNACNTEDELGEDRPLAASGRFSKCRSGYGVADLSGNAAEWTASAYAGNADKAQKGGSFTKPDYAARCSARKNGSPGSRGADVGFRCCADP
ncbi:MAG: SUMF1/EgtB/PvdO family nonheme iron enzyme [Myxococcaceae bacterium]|nr:SUMF1/EgtB/PvdO family nonheme iron enzyme [Myxococcaceae bacterium]